MYTLQEEEEDSEEEDVEGEGQVLPCPSEKEAKRIGPICVNLHKSNRTAKDRVVLLSQLTGMTVKQKHALPLQARIDAIFCDISALMSTKMFSTGGQKIHVNVSCGALSSRYEIEPRSEEA